MSFLNSVNGNISLVIHNFNDINQNVVSLLPKEIVLEIFSYLNVPSLGKICLVSKEWKRIASEPNLWKAAIYKEHAFGNNKWAKYFGKDVVKDEDYKEEFSSLPWNEFIEDSKKFKSFFPEKNTLDILMLVRIPKTLKGGLTLKNLGELTKKMHPDKQSGYGYMTSDISNNLGNKAISKSYWVLMTKEIISESQEKNIVQLENLICDLAQKGLIGYEIPNTLEAAVCILTQYFDKNVPASKETFTRCKENIESNDNGTIVGNFAKTGPIYFMNIGISANHHGVAFVRKF